MKWKAEGPGDKFQQKRLSVHLIDHRGPTFGEYGVRDASQTIQCVPKVWGQMVEVCPFAR